MKTILLTGATGFLGSALAANLLAEGARVKTLSRNDPAGTRGRAAIDQAARGFGLLLEDAHWARLSPVEVDFRNLPGTLAPEVLADVTHVWNAAAEMSYSLKKILQAVEQNVVAASALYGLTAQHAPRCQRSPAPPGAAPARDALPAQRRHRPPAHGLVHGGELRAVLLRGGHPAREAARGRPGVARPERAGPAEPDAQATQGAHALDFPSIHGGPPWT